MLVTGDGIATATLAMFPSNGKGQVRSKAVWGPKRLFVGLAILVLACAPEAQAAGRHSRAALRTRSGQPNSNATHRKLDRELAFRADHLPASSTTRVIVTLRPGVELPADF